MKRYNNYHKHTHISSIYVPDSNAKCQDYINRCLELNEPNYFTTEHGTGGDIFEARTTCDTNGINCKFGMEGYIVPDASDKKDNRNYHIVLIPKTNNTRKKLNKISYHANVDGFYYRPRLFVSDLLNEFDDNELYITTACIAGLLRDDDSINQIFFPLYEKFGKNLMLEVQTHNVGIQKEINNKAIKYSTELGLPLIGANDSHYINYANGDERLELLRGKGINYSDEDEFILDYPDYDTMVNRFIKQGILTNQQIDQAMEQTLIFDECENIDINKDIKMPTIYPDKSDDEKIKILKDIVNQNFQQTMIQDNIPKEKWKNYIDEIRKDMKVVEETSEVHSNDYFLFNYDLTKLAINKYGGTLTRTGRGSCGAFILNKILGITQIDRLATTLPLYGERFASSARLLENHAMPDIDFNIVEQEPFVKASRELFGNNGCFPMIAYGTMKTSEAFRNVCRYEKLSYDEYNEVAKNLEAYENDPKWKSLINHAKRFEGTIISASVHPCAHLIMNDDITEEMGVIRVGDYMCAMITSNEADEWKYLKDDFLIVTVWDIIKRTFDLIGKPIMNIRELLENLDDSVWDLFAKGMTCTLNQVDGDWATKLIKIYKPRSMEELAMFVACIRPSFDSFRDDFINRREYTTGSKELDEVLSATNHYVLFQENLMQYFEWLGITPAESIGLIKKISKKKIKQKDFDSITERMKKVWVKKIGTDSGFDETWHDMQSMMSYGFNCISGDTIIQKPSTNGNFIPTVEEMYNIRNNRQYAIKNGHKALYFKYRKSYGYGLSLYDDKKIHKNNIVDIKYAGIKPVYKIVTQSGKFIKCTDNHKFPTPNGKKMLKDLKIGDYLYSKGEYSINKFDAALTNGDFNSNIPKKGEQGFQHNPNGVSVIYDSIRELHINNKDCCELCSKPFDINDRFELHHKDGDRKNNNKDNFQWLCASCHKKEHYKKGRTKQYEKGINSYLDPIVSIEYIGEERTYDIAMQYPYHNFIANNGIVTSNSPHGEAYALDCLYCAYLKSHYPLEYYTSVLNVYQKNDNKTARLTDEMSYFGITMKNIKFRYSNDQYNMDKENNAIYKAISSIKGLNNQSAKDLYEIKNIQFDTFYDLLKLCDKYNDHKILNSKQLEILIKLDYFSEFGDINYLLMYVTMYARYGKRKTIKKPLPVDIDLTGCYNKETEKQYSQLDNKAVVERFMEYMVNIPKTTDYDRIRYEQQYLGYIDITIPSADPNIFLVQSANANKWGTVFTSLYRICDGKVSQYRVDKSTFKVSPFEEGAILKCGFKAHAISHKVTDENGKESWERTGEYDSMLSIWTEVE